MFISIKKWNICTEENIYVEFIPTLIRQELNKICKLALSSIHQLNMIYNVILICSSRYESWQQIIKLSEQFYKYQEFFLSWFSKVPPNISRVKQMDNPVLEEGIKRSLIDALELEDDIFNDISSKDLLSGDRLELDSINRLEIQIVLKKIWSINVSIA